MPLNRSLHTATTDMAQPFPRRRRAVAAGAAVGPRVLMPLLLGVVGLLAVLATLARAEEGQQKKPTVPWGKSAVYIKGNWVPFDEDDEAGVPQPYPPKTDSWRSNDTSIMVSISSFRDYRCAKTLYNLFTKATNPDRVYAGVVQQNNEGDVDCLYDYCRIIKQERNIEPKVNKGDQPKRALENCPHASQVSMLRVQAEDAKGPTYGRYLGGKLLGDQEFCMQIDAHMDFEDDWDKKLLDMWGLANNEYGVLTTYVPHLDQLHLNLNGRYEVPQICKILYARPGDMVRNEQATNCIWLSRPKLTVSWAAGFSFNKCHADRRVPYDPHLPSLFDGEEYSKYARLWTRGYDTYTPHRSVVYHDYGHGADTKDANAWSRKHRELQRSHDRLRTLLGMPTATVPRDSEAASELLGRWDLGKARSLNQLIAYTGIDTRNLKSDFDNCGKLQWVPFDEGHEDDDGFAAEERERRRREAADPVEEAVRRLEATAVRDRTLQPRGATAERRRRGGKGGMSAGASVHALGERLPISEEGAGRVLAGMCMLAFVVLIVTCLQATPLTRRQNRGLLRDLGLPTKSVTKRV